MPVEEGIIDFDNDNFTIRKKETAEKCELIVKNMVDLEWGCDTGVDLISSTAFCINGS